MATSTSDADTVPLTRPDQGYAQRRTREWLFLALALVNGITLIFVLIAKGASASNTTDLHAVYHQALHHARYVDLTHSIQPGMPIWEGFATPTFGAAVGASTVEGFIEGGAKYTYGAQGFVATSVTLPTDQLGTQLDPPAHWNEFGATISDVPPTVSVRPLVVIDVTGKVASEPGYHATATDVLEWEATYGRVPTGSVVLFRTDWSRGWDAYATDGMPATFPGVGLSALRLLHLERSILVHGHEPLDTDGTPNLEGEAWLMHHNFMQIEGVANLHMLPPTGALISIGFPKVLGGTGGYARLIAICPADWPFGVAIDQQSGAPLPTQSSPLRRDGDGVMRPTPAAVPTEYCAATSPLGCPLPP